MTSAQILAHLTPEILIGLLLVACAISGRHKTGLVSRIIFYLSRTLLVLAGLYVLFAATSIVCVLTAKPISSKAACEETTQKLIEAGGADKVRAEAIEILEQSAVGNARRLQFISPSDYPAIAFLGSARMIHFENPPYITIHVGMHNLGYTIQVFDPNNSTRPKTSPTFVEISPSIYVSTLK